MANELSGRQVYVLGSGPGSATPPEGLAAWSIMTVNASQVLLDAWGAHIPHYTLFNVELLSSKRGSCEAARVLLKGRRTSNLIVIEGNGPVWRTRLRLFLLRYRYDGFSAMTPRQRIQIVSSVLGADISERLKPSNGIFLSFLALHMGASRVLMSGFSLTQKGHAYNTLNHRRKHVDEDRELLAMALAAGLPIYTNSRQFSAESAVPFLAESPSMLSPVGNCHPGPGTSVSV